MSIRTFRDLIVWQRGMEIAKVIYRQTGAMPESERFGLIAQMRRAAVSIPSNIAEGHARGSRKDYLRFVRIAQGSLAELRTQHELAIDLGMLPRTEQLESLLAEQDRMLNALMSKLRTK